MAITRAQQAKQMLQDGGMLVKPGFGGKRQGYRQGDRESYGAEGQYADSGGKSGQGGGGQKGPPNRREAGIRARFTGPSGRTTGLIGNLNPDLTRSRNPLAQFGPKPPALYDDFGPTTRNFNFMQDMRKKVNPLGVLTQIPGTIGFIARALTPNPFGFGPPAMELQDPTRGDEGGKDIPIWMQLGYSSEAEYLAAMAGGASPSEPAATEDPPVDLNKVAYRLMADGGAVMDDEPRQAYGLGSIVKKATRAIKKVAKSDIGKLALLYAGTAGLGSLAAGGGMGSLFKLGTYAPSSFAANVPKIFSRAGLKNILVGGKGASLGGNRGMGAGIIPKFSGILGSGGALSPLKAITAVSALPFFLGDEEEDKEAELDSYLTAGLDIDAIRADPRAAQGRAFRLMAEGGSTEEKEPVAKKVMPLIDMDGKEKDYRETGGFVDIGRMEKADDVPARLSKNEFVFTADAVRNAGDGSVDKGAEVMYNMMKNLEAGGEVSEESQGLEGARKMFQTSQRLEEVL